MSVGASLTETTLMLMDSTSLLLFPSLSVLAPSSAMVKRKRAEPLAFAAAVKERLWSSARESSSPAWMEVPSEVAMEPRVETGISVMR